MDKVNEYLLECPLCRKNHYIGIYRKKSEAKFKGEDIVYIEEIHFCGNKNEKLYNKETESKNLLNVINSFRKKHKLELITQEQFKELQNIVVMKKVL